jgi:phage terminase large subunit-like protein
VTQPPVQLGMKWLVAEPESQRTPDNVIVNTRTSLWPDRWPAIAKQVCIDTVEAAPVALQSQVKWELPCADCELNTACLNAKRKEIGSLMYDREILTQPRSSESTLFPRTLIDPMLLRGEPLSTHYFKPFTFEHEYVICQAWDLAWSERTGGDFLVCMTGVIHRNSGRRRLLDIQRWQRISFDDQIKMIEDRWQWFNAEAVVIESDAAQQIWAQHVGRNTAVPVVPHTAGDKSKLATGVPGLLILFENRKWEFPFGPGYHHEEVETFLSELEAFGWNDGKLEGVGEHDDTVMCFWHLNWLMDKMVGTGVQERHVGVNETREM